mmetsp:Transcript_5999/g.14856  ORF Transcript_5999/g.14856 Transcript_5999/m.14856 type:complete len:254 (+) Transcript_5999:121-882(+)
MQRRLFDQSPPSSAAVPLGERRRRRRAHDLRVLGQVLADGGGAVDEVGVVEEGGVACRTHALGRQHAVTQVHGARPHAAIRRVVPDGLEAVVAPLPREALLAPRADVRLVARAAAEEAVARGRWRWRGLERAHRHVDELELLLALPEAVHPLVLDLEDRAHEGGALARLCAQAAELQALEVGDPALHEDGRRVGEHAAVAVHAPEAEVLQIRERRARGALREQAAEANDGHWRRDHGGCAVVAHHLIACRDRW